jgi:hypothetical protein
MRFGSTRDQFRLGDTRIFADSEELGRRPQLNFAFNGVTHAAT